MIRSRFWDDLADDLRSTRLRRVFLRAYIRFARRVPYVRRTQRVRYATPEEVNQRFREALEYFEDFGDGTPPPERDAQAETRLRARRCRCGKLAAEAGGGCLWHASVSARYAADLSAALDVAARVMAEAERLSPGSAAAAWHQHVDEALFASSEMAQGLRDWLAGDVEDA